MHQRLIKFCIHIFNIRCYIQRKYNKYIQKLPLSRLNIKEKYKYAMFLDEFNYKYEIRLFYAYLCNVVYAQCIDTAQGARCLMMGVNSIIVDSFDFENPIFNTWIKTIEFDLQSNSAHVILTDKMLYYDYYKYLSLVLNFKGNYIKNKDNIKTVFYKNLDIQDTNAIDELPLTISLDVKEFKEPVDYRIASLYDVRVIGTFDYWLRLRKINQTVYKNVIWLNEYTIHNFIELINKSKRVVLGVTGWSLEAVLQQDFAYDKRVVLYIDVCWYKQLLISLYELKLDTLGNHDINLYLGCNLENLTKIEMKQLEKLARDVYKKQKIRVLKTPMFDKTIFY